MQYLYSIVIFVGLALAYAFGYKVNNSIPIPSDCEIETPNCNSCGNLLCSHHEVQGSQKGGE